jgi:hypothetical protein
MRRRAQVEHLAITFFSGTARRAIARPSKVPGFDYVVRNQDGWDEALAISIPSTETAIIRHFQERMPYVLFVPEMPQGTLGF